MLFSYYGYNSSYSPLSFLDVKGATKFYLLIQSSGASVCFMEAFMLQQTWFKSLNLSFFLLNMSGTPADSNSFNSLLQTLYCATAALTKQGHCIYLLHVFELFSKYVIL